MYLKRIILSSFFLTFAFGDYNYSLEDLNSTSDYYQQNVGTSFFSGQITLHYFGHFNWGTCTARFGQLNDLYGDLVINGYNQVKLIGVGKSQHISFLSNWTNGNDASVCADDSPYPIWSEWGASQRDLFVLDHDGNIVFHENVTGGIPSDLSDLIIDLVSQIPDDYQLGDTNSDGVLNVLDVVLMVNLALSGGYEDIADMNSDGVLNVLDVVILIGIILN